MKGKEKGEKIGLPARREEKRIPSLLPLRKKVQRAFLMWGERNAYVQKRRVLKEICSGRGAIGFIRKVSKKKKASEILLARAAKKKMGRKTGEGKKRRVLVKKSARRKGIRG